MTTRLFKHPLSFTIYSQPFATLPPRARDFVLRRLREVLTNQDSPDPLTYLNRSDKQAILEILTATKRDWLADVQR